MAEARSAVSEPRVVELDEGKDAKTDFIRAWRKAFFRRFFRTRNQVLNGMWPTSWWNLGVTFLIFSVFLIGDWQWAKPINDRLWALAQLLHIHEGVPYILRVLLVSSLGGVVFFIVLMYKRRWLLRVLLSYRGWMYENVKTMSWKTKVWAVFVRLISGYHPATFSCQKSLPFLPVPDLEETLDKFLVSIEPLYGKDSEELEKFRTQANDFKKGIGQKFQRILVLKSWWAQNWVTDWWEKYIYLMGRTPIAINSNYYILDHGYWKPTNRQVSRAANAIFHYVGLKRQIDHETLTPLVLRKTIPLCMAQYERVFSSTRIPGEDVDELVKYDSSVSRHIIVKCKGLYYKLEVFDAENNPVNHKNLEKQLEWIVKDADVHQKEYSAGACRLAALTGIERTEWARIRHKHFTSGINKDSIEVIDSALFHVVLDDCHYKTWAERGKHLLHGDGSTVWFDKSFTLIFFSDGKMGINAEHSWGDAPVIGHMSEYHLTDEVLHPDRYDENGYCQVEETTPQAAIKQPERLVWDVNEELETKVSQAYSFVRNNNMDLDLCVEDHQAYGKGFIKTCKVSPDAYVQLALQLAYFRDSGKLALTYEASMTRLYLLGRTETVRSLTNECADFVRSMADKSMTNKERIALLRRACDVHQGLYRDAMNGRGIDRHLFGLYVACKGLGYESEFLKSALMMPWTLSTSQQPQQQIAASPDCNKPIYQDKICPGGGFGPVSDAGYGVSYMIPGDARIFFHVSSKRSSKALTNSSRFMKHLFESLADIKALFSDGPAKEEK